MRSWLESANDEHCGFPLASLPLCAFLTKDHQQHLGVGIGDFLLDLHACVESGFLPELDEAVQAASTAPTLNALIRCGPESWSGLRTTLQSLLRDDTPRSHQAILKTLLIPQREATFALPVDIHDYTDFYASRHHAERVGKLFRPDNPLLPNYDWLPIGYHGRASSLIVSGTDVTRPCGQRLQGGTPVFGPSLQLDYEVELGAIIGPGNYLGEPIPIAEAQQHIFGYTLVNDWSARDIQSWEYQPLGPFLGKSFATSLGPWVVPAAALEPYRIAVPARDPSMPQPLPYLTEPADARSALDITLEVWLATPRMRAEGRSPIMLSRGNALTLHWSFAQMIAHHTSNGCNLRAGDLLASGTISGPDPGSEGCLLEKTRRGEDPLRLPNGELRSFLEDGDEVILKAFCEREGLPRISFGHCRGTILPAR